jgi:hypothetical protein
VGKGARHGHVSFAAGVKGIFDWPSERRPDGEVQNKLLQTKMLTFKTPRMGVNSGLGGRICISIRRG